MNSKFSHLRDSAPSKVERIRAQEMFEKSLENLRDEMATEKLAQEQLDNMVKSNTEDALKDMETIKEEINTFNDSLKLAEEPT